MSLNHYALSIQALCVRVGLPIPPSSVFPPYNANRHLAAEVSSSSDMIEAEAARRLSEAYISENVYLHGEVSPQWRARLAQTAPTERHLHSVRRRLTMELFDAMRKYRCIYCWLAVHMCMCRQLEALRAEVAAHLHDVVGVTMLMHPEEMLRSTNTGHLVAAVLNCEVRLWGVADDDAWLLDAVQHNSREDRDYTYVLLYPEDGCQTVAQFSKTSDTIAEVPSQSPEHVGSIGSSPRPARTRLHFILSDGTWNQAHRVNRHVPRGIPRVCLTISEEYQSLFTPLRKQTRSTGVSTLEATVMAVAQQLRSGNHTDSAQLVEERLTTLMKRYVDVVSVQSRRDPVFCVDTDEDIERLKQQRQMHHLDMMGAERRSGRRVPTPERIKSEEYKRLAAPPVLSYCYVCDMWVGWSRMPGHVMGVNHKELLRKNPNWCPSQQSAGVLAANFHIQKGREVPLLSAAAN